MKRLLLTLLGSMMLLPLLAAEGEGKAADNGALGLRHRRSIANRRADEIDALAVGDVEGEIEVQLLGCVETTVEGVSAVGGPVAVDVLRAVGAHTSLSVVDVAHGDGIVGALVAPFQIVIGEFLPVNSVD